MSAVLRGLTTPISYLSWDHTYVESDCGWIWRCWGSYTQGQPPTNGVGNSFLANCLSKPLGTAEITYGIDGVCHQTANRILLPTMTRVSSARGYNVSLYTYGDYGVRWPIGRHRWMRRLSTCISQSRTSMHTDYDEADQQKIAGKGQDMAQSSLAYGLVDESPAMGDLLSYMESGSTFISEFDRIFAGVELVGEERNDLLKEKSEFHALQAELVNALGEGVIDKRVYLKRTNEILRVSMEKNRFILGDERFSRVFGETGYEPDGLIDESIFLGEPSTP